MLLSKITKQLHKLASPSFAGSWDNVGLLVEPSAPHFVDKIFLTNDLTPPVLEEAIESKSDLIVSYHPPIFAPLKRLTQRKWKEQIIVQCIENKIAVYSPHTSYDCVEGGVNDWLIGCFDVKDVRPIEPHEELPSIYTHTLRFTAPQDDTEDILDRIQACTEVNVLSTLCDSGDASTVKVYCTPASLARVMVIIHDSSICNVETSALAKVPKPGYGMGRKARLVTPVSVDDAVGIVKEHLKLDNVRLALSPEHAQAQIESVAVCAGSGSDVLRNVRADLYITGEMSHHDVLHAVYNGTSVILCDHSNTERGYLCVLQENLEKLLGSEISVVISNVDTDPLKVV